MAKKKVAKRQPMTAEYMLLYRLKERLGEDGKAIVFNAQWGNLKAKKVALNRIEKYLRGKAQPALRLWLDSKLLELELKA